MQKRKPVKALEEAEETTTKTAGAVVGVGLGLATLGAAKAI